MVGTCVVCNPWLLDKLEQMWIRDRLYAHRARLRKERGCIDFESGEVKLILDENGHCIDVKTVSYTHLGWM